MSIELPPIPAQPTVESTPEQWTHYRWAVSLHVTAEQTAAINRQAAATEATASIAQQMLDQPNAPAPVPAPLNDNAHRVVVAALMTEGGADKTPADVATAVLARVAAVDTMLGG